MCLLLRLILRGCPVRRTCRSRVALESGTNLPPTSGESLASLVGGGDVWDADSPTGESEGG